MDGYDYPCIPPDQCDTEEDHSYNFDDPTGEY